MVLATVVKSAGRVNGMKLQSPPVISKSLARSPQFGKAKTFMLSSGNRIKKAQVGKKTVAFKVAFRGRGIYTFYRACEVP